MKKQAFPGNKLFTSRLPKHARVQLHGGPPALVSLRLLIAFPRC